MDVSKTRTAERKCWSSGMVDVSAKRVASKRRSVVRHTLFLSTSHQLFNPCLSEHSNTKWKDMHSMSDAYYDVAQVCKNGHVINNQYKKTPMYNTKHCVDCGAETITKCQECENDIRGELSIYDNRLTGHTGPTPNCCIECGKPYPWTQDKIDAFRELVELSSLKPDKKRVLSDGIIHIISDTPKTKLTCVRFVTLVSKEPLLKSAILDIAVKSAKEVLESLWAGAPLT